MLADKFFEISDFHLKSSHTFKLLVHISNVIDYTQVLVTHPLIKNIVDKQNFLGILVFLIC